MSLRKELLKEEMSLRKELLKEAGGVLIEAASVFAERLNRDRGAQIGYSQANAILAAVEMFPEVTEARIKQWNDWAD